MVTNNADVNVISIKTSTVNGLKTPIKNKKYQSGLKKTRSNYMLSTRSPD